MPATKIPANVGSKNNRRNPVNTGHCIPLKPPDGAFETSATILVGKCKSPQSKRNFRNVPKRRRLCVVSMRSHNTPILHAAGSQSVEANNSHVASMTVNGRSEHRTTDDSSRVHRTVVECRACGTLGYAGEAYCVCCGASMTETRTRLLCVSCGTLIDHSIANYCPHCGCNLTDDRPDGNDADPTGTNNERPGNTQSSPPSGS